MRIGTLFITAALLGVLFGDSPAYVYRYTDSGLVQKWKSTTVPYYINNAGGQELTADAFASAVRSGFAQWRISNSALNLNEVAPLTSQTQVGYTSQGGNINLVISDKVATKYSPPGGAYHVTAEHGSATIGITLSTYNATTGEILDCDIVFNEDYNYTTTNKTDLTTKTINLKDVATHEIGHLVGLDHTFIDQATMWPYAADGQQTLHADDSAGVGSLYPNSLFYSSTDSVRGRVTDSDNQPVWGIYVVAMDQAAGLEKVAGITGPDGFYSIAGLDRTKSYALKARSVDLGHLGDYMEGGSSEEYIPEYYNNAYRLQDATLVHPGDSGRNFQLGLATLLARYTQNFTGSVTIISPGSNLNSSKYLGVRFPADSLPRGFAVFGMTFFNNDDDMFWPRIILTTGSGTTPDLTNILRQATNYVGRKTDYSTVEWETISLTNSRDLWVVFQMPNKNFTGIGTGGGPGIGGENNSPNYRDEFFSSDNGASFQTFWADGPSYNFDLLVRLTVSLLDTLVPNPVIDVFPRDTLAFGVSKIGAAKTLPLLVSNLGGADLVIYDIYTNRPTSFTVSTTKDTIRPLGTDTVWITFRPISTASLVASLNIDNNDTTKPSWLLWLTGSGAYPAASVKVQSLAFGEVEVGSSSAESFYVYNSGQVPLGLTGVSSSSGDFQVQSPPSGVAASDSAELTVLFSPSAEGAISGSLTIGTDDPSKPQIAVGLSGTGIVSVVIKSCDFNQDGKNSILDLITFLALAKNSRSDPRLDWNEDGVYTIFDLLAFLKDLTSGACPAPAGLLAGSESKWAPSLSELAQVEKIIGQMEFTPQERTLLLDALHGWGETAGLPLAFSLGQNSPNPFNPSTLITFTVPGGASSEAPVSIRVYDLRGKQVRVLADGPQSPGTHAVVWDGVGDDGQALPSGIYIYRMTTGGFTATRKMVLLK